MIWLDAHLSPRVADWIREVLGYEAAAVRDLGLRDSDDHEIFDRGREADAIGCWTGPPSEEPGSWTGVMRIVFGTTQEFVKTLV